MQEVMSYLFMVVLSSSLSELPVGIFFERNELVTEEEAEVVDVCVRALQLSPDNVDDTYTVSVTSEDSTATGIVFFSSMV